MAKQTCGQRRWGSAWSWEKEEVDFFDSLEDKVTYKKNSEKVENKKVLLFSNIVKGLRWIHKKSFSEMDFLFCFKINSNRFLIFQDISSLPIKRIVSKNVNHSIGFYTEWKMPTERKKSSAEFVEWGQIDRYVEMEKEIQEHMKVNNSGLFDSYSMNLRNWNSSVKHSPRLHFRIEDVYLINISDDFFEIYSDTISLIGVKHKKFFPHQRENRKGNLNIGWTNCKFTLSYDIDKTSVPLNARLYWKHKRLKSEKEDDKIINELSIGNERQEIKDVGQRGSSDIIIEENNE